MTVSRFAPAPTGYLHLGHVFNAIWVWGATRARGGRVLLRIEDHDRQRSRPEFEEAILEDLEWLGFVADADVPGPAHGPAPTSGDDKSGPAPTLGSQHVGADLRVRPVRQSDRGAIYDAALARLRAAGLVYACDCTRAAIAQTQTTSSPDQELRYPGTCAGKRLAE